MVVVVSMAPLERVGIYIALREGRACEASEEDDEKSSRACECGGRRFGFWSCGESGWW